MADLSFRPSTYWPPDDPAPSGASTPEERAEARELGRMHPAFMGGAYLPDGEPGEVEIARIDSRSTTADVVSIRGRRSDHGIAYRVVDEYEVTWVVPMPTSDAPLTLGEIMELLEGAHMADEPAIRGLTNAWRERNLMEPCDASELVDFLRVTSRSYPDLERLDRERAKAWAARINDEH